MRFFILLLTVVGCSYDYTVESHTKQTGCNEVTLWKCEEEKFGGDSTVAVCDTKEQCNAICSEMRKESK